MDLDDNYVHAGCCLISTGLVQIYCHILRKLLALSKTNFCAFVKNFLQDLHFFKNCISIFSILLAVVYEAIFSKDANDYHVKAISTVEEARALIEVGFEYVTDVDSKKLFRKRK